MRENFQGLHSYIRRPGMPAAELVPFYRDVIGLPIIRPVGEMVTFWAGEDYGFEIKCDDQARRLDSDPMSAQCLPVFRSKDLAATERRLSGLGHEPSHRTTSEHGTCSWYACPDGHAIGFEERSENSPFEADQIALARLRAGTSQLPGVGPLPDDLHYLARILVRVHDVDAVSDFYASTIGLDLVGVESGARVHSLGDTALLIIAPGGAPRSAPTDRIEVGNIISNRIHDFDDFLAYLDRNGVALCGAPIEFSTGTRASYLVDPEGNLFGFQQRTLWGNYPEDVESDRRWQAVRGARSAIGTQPS